jgi:hypothetical protein
MVSRRSLFAVGQKREEEREITRNCLVESYRVSISSFLLNFDIMGGVFLTSR